MPGRLLPLFPLPLVVFPRVELPLHIFEERYKEMVGEAIANHSEFGIVLAKEEGIVNAGCTVVVEKILKNYPDGRMDILTRGCRRFEITSLNQDKSYLRGEVEFFDDDDPSQAPPEVRERALLQYRHLVEVMQSRDFAEPVLTDAQLSFQLAQGIPEPDFLQVLLRSRSESERLKQLASFLSEYIPRQRLTARMKSLAPSNGHGARPPGV